NRPARGAGFLGADAAEHTHGDVWPRPSRSFTIAFRMAWVRIIRASLTLLVDKRPASLPSAAVGARKVTPAGRPCQARCRWGRVHARLGRGAVDPDRHPDRGPTEYSRQSPAATPGSRRPRGRTSHGPRRRSRW